MSTFELAYLSKFILIFALPAKVLTYQQVFKASAFAFVWNGACSFQYAICHIHACISLLITGVFHLERLEPPFAPLKLFIVQISQETHRREESDSIWEAQSTLTLWLAQLVLIPFDLAVVDSSITSGTRCARPLLAVSLGRTPAHMQTARHHISCYPVLCLSATYDSITCCCIRKQATALALYHIDHLETNQHDLLPRTTVHGT